MNTLPLDPTIAALADAANAWLAGAYYFAGVRRMPVPAFLAECILTEQATSCGHLATASRGRSVRHAAYSSAVVKPPKRAKPMSDGEKFGLHGKAAAR
jgi:hypothetical protein